MSVADDFEARFRALFLDLPDPVVDLLAGHARMVAERNAVMNLTRIVDPAEMAIKHVRDALAALVLFEADGPLAGLRRICDAGSGAGWPGLALAAVRPDLEVTLLDARRKKADFLTDIIAELGLEARVDACWGRLDAWIAAHRRAIDVVAARALGPVDRILGWCEERWRGPVLLWKGPGADAELAEAAPRMARMRLELAADHRYELGDGIERRLLLLAPAPRR